MLVDSHCHLDFPDFSVELDAVVSRARAAGIGRMVTISTRVKRHAQILAIADKFSEVFCSVGTHPHYSDEELDIDAERLVAIAKHPKVVAIGEAGSTISETTVRAKRRSRASASISRRHENPDYRW